MSTPFVEDWRAALGLVARLDAGLGIDPEPGVAVSAAEPVYATLPATLDALRGARLAIATSDPRTHAAARQWHRVGGGRVLLTPVRLLVTEPAPGVSLGWSGLTGLSVDVTALLLTYGEQSFRVGVHCPVWMSVAVRWVGFGQVHRPEPPAWVAKELDR